MEVFFEVYLINYFAEQIEISYAYLKLLEINLCQIISKLQFHFLKINELNQSSQAGVIFFNSTPAKNTNF